MTGYQRFGLVFIFTVATLLAATSFYVACGGYLPRAALLAAMAGVFAFHGVAPASAATCRFRLLRRAVRGRVLASAAVTAAASALRPVVLSPSAATRGAMLSLLVVGVMLALPVELLAESPWSKAATAICEAFVGPIGKGLALVAFVVGGLMFAFGEGGSKSALAGLIFGAGMVLSAPAFLTWTLGTTAACG